MDGAQPDIAPPEDTANADSAESPDTSAVEDVPGSGDVEPPDDVAADVPITPDITGPPPPDLGGGEGCPDNPECFLPAAGTPDAAINLLDAVAPELTGGAPPTGWYELVDADVYIGETFTGVVTEAAISSNGATYGSLELTGDQWGLSANLDLHIVLTAVVGDPIDVDFLQPVGGGGCFTIDGNLIEGDFLQCGGAWVDGVPAPSGFEYQTGDGTVSVKIVLTVEMITALLPPEYQELAVLALAGDLPVVLNFAKP